LTADGIEAFARYDEASKRTRSRASRPVKHAVAPAPRWQLPQGAEDAFVLYGQGLGALLGEVGGSRRPHIQVAKAGRRVPADPDPPTRQDGAFLIVGDGDDRRVMTGQDRVAV
jgi:hypothetical protein